MDSKIRNRVGAVAGVVGLGVAGLVAAPGAAATEPPVQGEPGCRIVELVNSNPGPGSENQLDWWGVTVEVDEGVDNWAFHFTNKTPDDAWIYDYYMRADLEASEAAGHLVIPFTEDVSIYSIDPDTGHMSFFLLNRDRDPDPVAECVAG